MADASLIDVIAGEEHYAEHLAPVWEALPTEVRGTFYVRGSWSLPFETRPLRYGITFAPRVLVAAEGDRARAGRSRVIRMEHGIGISYLGARSSYAGGEGQRNVRLFLSPNWYPAIRWWTAYPSTPVEVTGSPRMDAWHARPPKPRSDRPVVAVSWHWDGIVCSETRTALPHFLPALPELFRRTDVEVIGHSHYRGAESRAALYREHGVEYVRSFDEVLARADLYVVDNSSTLYEFASVDRPVVVLNAPWYRRNVHHGLRFWERSDVGVNANEPAELNPAIDRALEDPPEVAAARRAANDVLFPYRARAAARTVETILREVT